MDRKANFNEKRELLAMCAWCKKIRNDEGRWEFAVDYFTLYPDTAITHSICEECGKQYFRVYRFEYLTEDAVYKQGIN
jgi:hypothetical protein